MRPGFDTTLKSQALASTHVMVRAVWKGKVIAESDETKVVEGNHYFPPEAVDFDRLSPSDHSTTCPWKGEASYYHVEANGERIENAAWTYPDPSDEARHIKDHVAFWKGVQVDE